MRNFEEICNHPIFSKHIAVVGCVGDVNFGPHYASSNGCDANVLWLSECGVFNDIPEARDCYKHRLLQASTSLQDARNQDYDVLMRSITMLPRLKELTYSRPLKICIYLPAFNTPKLFGARLAKMTEVENLCWNRRVVADLGTYHEVRRAEVVAETPRRCRSLDDAVGLHQVLRAFCEIRRAGKEITLCLRSFHGPCIFQDELAPDLQAPEKLSMLQNAMRFVTSLKLGHPAPNRSWGSRRHEFAKIVEGAENLERLELQAPFTEVVRYGIINEVLGTCTWPKLISVGFSRSTACTDVMEEGNYADSSYTAINRNSVLAFLTRHGHTLQRLYLNNIFLSSGRLNLSISRYLFEGSFVETCLSPLVEVSSQLPQLEQCGIFYDQFREIRGEYSNLLDVNAQIEAAGVEKGHVVDQQRQNVSATYDFGPWLMARREKKEQEAITASQE